MMVRVQKPFWRGAKIPIAFAAGLLALTEGIRWVMPEKDIRFVGPYAADVGLVSIEDARRIDVVWHPAPPYDSTANKDGSFALEGTLRYCTLHRPQEWFDTEHRAGHDTSYSWCGAGHGAVLLRRYDQK